MCFSRSDNTMSEVLGISDTRSRTRYIEPARTGESASDCTAATFSMLHFSVWGPLVRSARRRSCLGVRINHRAVTIPHRQQYAINSVRALTRGSVLCGDGSQSACVQGLYVRSGRTPTTNAGQSQSPLRMDLLIIVHTTRTSTNTAH